MDLQMTPSEQKLFNENMKLAYACASKYGKIYKVEYEDAVQQALIGLIIAVKRYNPELGALSTIAYYRMRRMIQRFAIENRPVRGTRKQVTTVSDVMLEHASTGEDVAQAATNRTVNEDLVEIGHIYLTGKYRLVFDYLYVEGKNQREVSEILHVSKQRVSQMNLYVKEVIMKHISKRK